jgi:hypothetical protein
MYACAFIQLYLVVFEAVQRSCKRVQTGFEYEFATTAELARVISKQTNALIFKFHLQALTVM